MVLPKSVHPTRITRNLDIFDFTLTTDEPGVQAMLLSAFDVHAND